MTVARILKPRVPKFRPDLSVWLKDIAEKQVPSKLTPIVGAGDWGASRPHLHVDYKNRTWARGYQAPHRAVAAFFFYYYLPCVYRCYRREATYPFDWEIAALRHRRIYGTQVVRRLTWVDGFNEI